MKKYILTALLIIVTHSAYALEWNTCIKYITRNDPNASWTLRAVDPQGTVIVIENWKSTVAQPTKADLEAVEATAIAWLSDKSKTDDANFEAWTAREKALCKLFVKEINKLRALHSLPAYTVEQVKAALKAEM
jgi:hypothetical protein